MIKKRINDHFKALMCKEKLNKFEDILLKLYRRNKKRYKNLKKYIHTAENRNINRIYIRARHIRSLISGEKFCFVALEDAIIWTSEWLKSFPIQYDIIVGIPRSGMLIASIIALKLGKPLTTPDLFAKKEFWLSTKVDQHPNFIKQMNVLLVDDSINSGKSMRESIDFMRQAEFDFDITTAALITSDETNPLVDIYYKYIKHPRIFEWNMLHRKTASYFEHEKIALDMDGVLCENCPPHTDSDENAYTQWIRSAKPYLIPSFEIDAIVSCRLEKYRADTVKWLSNHNVRYKKLILWNIESKKQRKGLFAKHKIDAILRINPAIFWESNLNQAENIWKATKTPVFCIDNWIMFN
ncbi:MAG: hypothetical protein JRF32_03620 [Deltaproteobacteria bacterium]|nr:hypothetical protein [Deltaproteobacteria bacterium]